MILLTILETIVILSFLFITYNVWDNLEINKASQIAYQYSNSKRLEFNIKNNITSLQVEEDKEAIKNNNIEINVNNKNEINRNYNLYIKIDNDSTVTKKYLKISLNNEIKNLTILENFQDSKNTYYLIKEDEINKKSVNDYIINLWLDYNNTPINEQNKTLIYDFLIEEI